MNGPTSSGPTGWHATDEMIDGYVRMTLDVARSASVEQHVLGCHDCRNRIGARARTDAGTATELGALWFDVIDAVDAPKPSAVGRLLRRLGCSDVVAAVVAATPALRLSWFGSIAAALVFAIVMATTADLEDAFLLVIAPLIPLIGIGTAYGAGVDPVHELTRAAPLPGSRVFLYRCVAVLVTAIPLVLVGSVLLAVDRTSALSWLLPALGLVGATLALSTWTQPRTAALIAGAGWLAALSGMKVQAARLDATPVTSWLVFRPGGQIFFAVLAVAGAALFWLRLEKIDAPESLTMEV